jgi:hypothetical protein
MSQLLEYTARPGALSIIGAVCGVLTGFGILMVRESPDSWLMAFLPAAIFMFAFAYMSQLRLVFAADGLLYASLFTRERTLRYHRIKSVSTVRNILFGSRNTFLIRTFDGNELRINTGLFPPEARARLIALKAERMPGAASAAPRRPREGGDPVDP